MGVTGVVSILELVIYSFLIYYLSISGIINRKPFQILRYLLLHVDKENPDEMEKDPPTDRYTPTNGHAAMLPPSDEESYNRILRGVLTQSGIIVLFVLLLAVRIFDIVWQYSDHLPVL